MRSLVRLNFEILGGPFEEVFGTMEEAKEYADTLACELAASLYRVLPNGEVEIPYHTPSGATGSPEEIEWLSKLSDKAGAKPGGDSKAGVPGSLPLETLAQRIRNDAIVITQLDDLD